MRSAVGGVERRVPDEGQDQGRRTDAQDQDRGGPGETHQRVILLADRHSPGTAWRSPPSVGPADLRGWDSLAGAAGGPAAARAWVAERRPHRYKD